MIEIVGRNDHVVVTAHIPQQPDGTALIELDKLLCDLGLSTLGCILQFIFNKDIPRNSGYMLFNKGVLVHQEINAEGRQNMFKFETVDPGGISFFDVEIS